MLGPPGGADVPMHVSGPRTNPVHRRQVTHRVGLMGMKDQLRLGGRARGEIETIWYERRAGDLRSVGIVPSGVDSPTLMRVNDSDTSLNFGVKPAAATTCATRPRSKR